MAERCRESAMGLSAHIPCGRPAVFMVDWPGRSEEPAVPMCLMCADHNVRNRRGRKVPLPDADQLSYREVSKKD